LAQKFKTHGTKTNESLLFEAQQRVKAKLKKFNKQAKSIWGDVDPGNLSFLTSFSKGKEAEDTLGDWIDDDSDLESCHISEDDDLDQDIHPNPAHTNVLLPLPSSIGVDACKNLERTSLMGQEIQLRLGQAYDALEDIRVALAHKSLLYRNRVQKSDNNKQSTRAFDAINRASSTISRHVTTYRVAYNALKNMGGLGDDLKPISNSDLKLAGDITEENRIGQKSDTLAWFWKLGSTGTSDGMEECKQKFFRGSGTDKIHLILVYRVNWLRARARRLRWKEEIVRIEYEMEWTTNSFQRHEESWMKRAHISGEAGNIGHRSFALAQAEMWKGFKDGATNKFPNCKFAL
jgi:hypothetical protein